MKKYLVFIIVFLLVCNLLMIAQQEKKDKPKKLNIQTAYVYKPESLLISSADLHCSFVIAPPMKSDMRIVGAQSEQYFRDSYADGEKMYVNLGQRDNISEGDLFSVVSPGKKIPHPFKRGNLGYYHQFCARAAVVAVFPNRSIVELRDTCNPVEIGDILIPFKDEEKVFKRSLKYTEYILPEGQSSGRVVFMDLYKGENREVGGQQNWMAVDMGRDIVKKGDMLLFYRKLKPDLPPIIIGTGIVIYPQNTNSTVKMVSAAHSLELGDYAVLLPEPKKQAEPETETLPILKKLKEEDARSRKDSAIKSFEAELMFDLDSYEMKEEMISQLGEAGEFIKNRPEYVVILKGYACSIGSDAHNLRLSKQRVNRIQDYLAERFNIDKGFFETAFYGEKEPKYDNSVEAERKKNRRVSVQIFAK